jgi:hypothetical protein
MMKSNNRTTTILLVLFFGGLLAYWGLDVSGVRPTSELNRRSVRILPDLIDTPEAGIRRVVIDREKEHLVFERRDKGLGRWQMVEPKDVAAEPARLDALVRNLKELRKDPDAGTVKGDPGSYGLAPPAATIRLYAGDGGSASAERPIAELEIGKVARDHRYVRPGGSPGIEVVGARLLAAVDQPVAEWRQPNVMGVPTFQVASVTIRRRDQPGQEPPLISAERAPSGRWRLTAPIEAPAEGPKVESLLGAISSLRVAEPPRGYVADDVKDAAPFGLARPAITVELKTQAGGDPMVLDIGKPVPDEPERVYVRQGGQDDVVMVEARALSEIPPDAIALRSHQVADLVPSAVTEIDIETRSDRFTVKGGRNRWELTSPRRERADAAAVGAFLSHIGDLQTSEFLDPQKVPDPMLDPPVMTIRIRQSASGRPPANPAEADTQLAVTLQLGRHDVLKKTIFARLEGDRVLLALPDKLLDVLPKNPLAFRDRSIVTDDPGKIKKLTIRRGPRVDEIVPDSTGPSQPNTFRMLRPVNAPADAGAVTQALTVLCGLRAEDFAAPSVGDGKAFGLDRPLMQIDWESEGTHSLKIGAAVPRSTNFYATRDGQSMVFTLPAATLRAFDAEYHDHRVMSFPTQRAMRVVLYFAGRTISLRHRPAQTRGQVEWVPEPGSDAEGIDLSRIGSLVQTLSQLQTLRFIQYEGEIPPQTGLAHPRLKVEVTLGAKGPTHVLRIGSSTDDGNVCAATGTGSSGAAFFLPGPPWNDLIRSGERLDPLPDNVFATPE